MSATTIGALAATGLLDVTHAIERDHVAGISSLTSDYRDSKLSALVGACFSFDHVVLVVVWLVIAHLLLGQTEFPAIFDAIGTIGVGFLLGLLGFAMTTSGLFRITRTGEQMHGEHSLHHPHLHVPLQGLGSHEYTTGSFLKIGLIGALFTLSPPVSMIVFSSTLFPDYGITTIFLAVVVYSVSITITMSLLGAGAGLLFGLTRERSERVYGITQTLAGITVAVLSILLLLDVPGTLL